MVDEENPLRPSHPPLYTTSKRITFRPITLRKINQSYPNQAVEDEEGQGEEEGRSIFLKQDARYGPNKPEKLPGRKRDRDRAARRAERVAAGMDVDGDDESEDEGMEVDDEPATVEGFTSLNTGGGAGPSTSPLRPITSPAINRNISPLYPSTQTPTSANTNTNTNTNRWSHATPIGRPRTRPVIEITSLAELAHLDINSLPANIRGKSSILSFNFVKSEMARR
jgi:hypothetical protein